MLLDLFDKHFLFIECPDSPPVHGHLCNSPGIQVQAISWDQIIFEDVKTRFSFYRNVTTRSRTRYVAAASVTPKGKRSASQIHSPQQAAGTIQFVDQHVALRVLTKNKHYAIFSLSKTAQLGTLSLTQYESAAE